MINLNEWIFTLTTTQGNSYSTKSVEISSQDNRDMLELMFTDFFNTNNGHCILGQEVFGDTPRTLRFDSIQDCRDFLRNES